MKQTWFCNFAAKKNWLLCFKTNTFLLNLQESTWKSGFYLNKTIALGSYILPLALTNSGEELVLISWSNNFSTLLQP